MTEAEITERLALYLAAERKILQGNQSWSVAQRHIHQRGTEPGPRRDQSPGDLCRSERPLLRLSTVGPRR